MPSKYREHQESEARERMLNAQAQKFRDEAAYYRDLRKALAEGRLSPPGVTKNDGGETNG